MDPFAQFLFYPCKAIIVHPADLSKEHIGVHDGKSADSNEARHPQARISEIRIVYCDDLVESRYFLTELGRDHADEPVLIPSRQSSNDQRRAELPRLLANLGKAKKDYLAFRNHVNDSLRSSRE